MKGNCTCGHIRYEIHRDPMFIHACHCTWCQRETGGPHAVNGIIESEQVELLEGEVDEVYTLSASGKGQMIVRCPKCHVAVWSHYYDRELSFIRVTTLEEPGKYEPDLHIYTSSKLPWYVIPKNVLSVPKHYDRDSVWPEESLSRRRKAFAEN